MFKFVCAISLTKERGIEIAACKIGRIQAVCYHNKISDLKQN